MFALRLARTDDLAALRALIDDSVRGLSAAHYTAEQIESGLRYVFGPDTQLIADGTYFVVEDGTQLAAAGGWSKRQTLYGGDQHKPAADPLLDPRTDAARIRAFFVHPDFARRGLGRMLFEACRSAAVAAGFRAFELGATLPGVPLYTSLGFTPVERADARLPDGVVLPIVRMRCDLAHYILRSSFHSET
jgi:GNAT superfamily N-acetyltransferase